MKKEKKKGNYSIFQNIRYSLGNIWKWDKGYYLAFIPQIPLRVFLPLAGVYFPKLLIDLIQNRASDGKMLLYIGVYSLMLLTATLVSNFCNARLQSMNYVFSFHYQELTAKKTNTMDFENLENPKIADMNKHTYSGGMAAERIAWSLNDLFINLLGIFTYSGIIIMLNPLLLILIVITSAVNYAVMSYVRNYTEKNKDKWASLDRKNDYLYGISLKYEHAKDIKLYRMRTWLSDLMVKYQDLRMVWYKKVWNRNFFSGLTDGWMRFIRDGAAYALLIWMLLDGRLDVSGFIFYFGAVTGLSVWLTSIIDQFNTVITYNVNINRLRAYLDIENKFNRSEGTPMPSKSETPYEIEFRDLTYNYPGSDRAAVDNINFTIKKGERLAVVGQNGAGKTTLIKLMCGLYYPTSGSVLLNGTDVKEYNVDNYYTQFSAVFQDIFLVPISIARFIAGDGENIDRTKISNVLALSGLACVVEKLPNGMDTTLVKGIYDDGIDLSGGEKQKLMLARALYKDAPVVVLDEPTAALDPIAENELYMKYAELTEGKTSVYISHRLSSTRFCDRIIYIKDGKIAECGTHAELMSKKGLYADMFEIQSHYYKDNITEEGKIDE